VSSPNELQGRSLKGLLAGEAAPRDAAYSEWHVHPSRCGVGLQLRTVRTKDWKCTFELASGAGEMYDLKNDPGEMDNLFDDPGRAHVKKQMEALLHARPGKVLDTLAEPIGMA
jgi:arylsulfatase A-like enzyme